MHQSAFGFVHALGGTDLCERKSCIEHRIRRFQSQLRQEAVDPFAARALFHICLNLKWLLVRLAGTERQREGSTFAGSDLYRCLFHHTRRDVVLTCDAASRIGANELLGVFELEVSRILAIVPERELLDDERLVHRREDGPGKSDIALVAENAIHCGEAAMVNARNGLIRDGPAIDEDTRFGVLSKDVAEAGVRVVRDGAQAREHDMSADDRRPVFTDAVSKNERNLAAAHLDVILVSVAAVDSPGDASVAVDFPARFRMEPGLQGNDAEQPASQATWDWNMPSACLGLDHSPISVE